MSQGAMQRLRPLRIEDLDSEQRDLYDALVGKSVGRGARVADGSGALRGPVGVLLTHPATGRPLAELAAVLRFHGRLPDLAREAAILVVAAHWRDTHEWDAHERIAREAGMTEAQVAGLRAEEPVTFGDAATAAAYEAAYAIVKRAALTDDEYARVRDALGDEQLVEVTVLVGYYGLLAMQLRVFGISERRW